MSDSPKPQHRSVVYLLEQIRDREQRIEQLERWIADLQSGMWINCVYCGLRYGPKESTPVTQAELLKAHIAVCPDHPAAEWKREVTRLNAALDEIGAVLRQTGRKPR